MPLRDYQQDAFNATIEHIKKNVEPCIVEAPTASGKSWIIATVAKVIHEKSNKKVLCLAPSKELVEQNREKYLLTGNPASLYSASAGKKCLRHPVIFGTPLTVKNPKAIKVLAQNIAAVVIDEAHSITPTIKEIIESLKKENPYIRIIGFTATPYRLDSGYIYEIDLSGDAVEETVNPYFHKLIYRIDAKYLIEKGYITKPSIGQVSDNYQTSHMVLQNNNKYLQEDIDRAFVGHDRKTSRIIADIIEKGRNRMGVMIFAATIKHAEECMASLPREISAIVTGTTPKKERAKILADFKAQKIKYLVNVSTLTTGFDAPNVDVVALLRLTESAALLQQMIGRALRIMDGKHDALILDYAENIERHAPDGDIFNPEISAPKKSKNGTKLKIECPWCKYENVFSKRKDMLEYECDKHGYALDLVGMRIISENKTLKSCENKPYVPVHYGRRCEGIVLGTNDRCGYRWTYKECDECRAPNDMAARYCSSCKAEIVNPNDKLKEDFARMKSDPYTVSTDYVRSWTVRDTVSMGGNPMYRVIYRTDYATVEQFVLYNNHKSDIRLFLDVTQNAKVAPKTITYYKDRASKFWRVIDYNRPIDKLELIAE